MFLQITAQPDARLIGAAMRHGMRRNLMIARLAGWTALVAALLIDITTDAGLSPSLLIVGVALAVGVPLVLINTGARRALRESRLTTYEITDIGVASSSLDSRHAYTWESLDRVDQLPGQLIFGRNTGWFLAVPTTELSRAQIEQVLATAEAHGVEARRSVFSSSARS